MILREAIGSELESTVRGVSTNVVFPVVSVLSPPAAPPWWAEYADVSSAVDSEVTITLKITPERTWYVYGDAGVHLTLDPNLRSVNVQVGDATPSRGLLTLLSDGIDAVAPRSSEIGMQYTIPSVPSTAEGDHPPNELKFASAVLATSGVVVAAPGSGQRHRIFAAQVVPGANAIQGYLRDSLSGAAFCSGSNLGAGQLQYLPSGLPLYEDAAISYDILEGEGHQLVVVVYTTETI